MRRAATLAVLVLVSAVAAGCSDDGDSDSDGSDNEQEATAVALTTEQIAEAVLQEDNMGEGWTSEPSTDDDSVGPGCFADIDTLTEDLEDEAKGGTAFEYGEAEQPYVESTITAYADESGIAAVFDQVQTVLGACSTISDTDDEGGTWELSMTYDDASSIDDVDDQFTLNATGTYLPAGGSTTIAISIDWTSFRVGPNVGTVTTIDTESRPTEHANWAAIAGARLVAVAHGEEPEPTTAPAPSGAAA